MKHLRAIHLKFELKFLNFTRFLIYSIQHEFNLTSINIFDTYFHHSTLPLLNQNAIVLVQL